MVKHLKFVSKCKNRYKRKKEKTFTSLCGSNKKNKNKFKKLKHDCPGSFFASSAPAPT